MFSNISFLELILLCLVMALPVAIGYRIMRGIGRREATNRDLYALTDEVRALTEQNAGLARELADLSRERDRNLTRAPHPATPREFTPPRLPER